MAGHIEDTDTDILEEVSRFAVFDDDELKMLTAKLGDYGHGLDSLRRHLWNEAVDERQRRLHKRHEDTNG